MLREPLYQLSRQINELQRATAGLQRIEELHRVQTNIIDGTDRLSTHHPLSVHFDNVTFAYNPGEPVLENVSFDLEPGKVLGLLGRTGSGKTTTTRLLFRFYDIQSGSIRLGKQSISDIQLSDLRQHVGLVTQDVQLFNATVRENLTLFDPTIPDDRIASALDDLDLGSWYRNLPNGLDTEIASGSSGLSAGEAQLLAFARVFLKDPGLVILDEPSSRLDPATERKITHAGEHLLEDRTGIIIAHRLDTVEKVSDIMILDEGSILEHGRRHDLAARNDSHFSRLLKTGMEDLIT